MGIISELISGIGLDATAPTPLPAPGELNQEKLQKGIVEFVTHKENEGQQFNLVTSFPTISHSEWGTPVSFTLLEPEQADGRDYGGLGYLDYSTDGHLIRGVMGSRFGGGYDRPSPVIIADNQAERLDVRPKFSETIKKSRSGYEHQVIYDNKAVELRIQPVKGPLRKTLEAPYKLPKEMKTQLSLTARDPFDPSELMDMMQDTTVFRLAFGDTAHLPDIREISDYQDGTDTVINTLWKGDHKTVRITPPEPIAAPRTISADIEKYCVFDKLRNTL